MNLSNLSGLSDTQELKVDEWTGQDEAKAFAKKEKLVRCQLNLAGNRRC